MNAGLVCLPWPRVRLRLDLQQAKRRSKGTGCRVKACELERAEQRQLVKDLTAKVSALESGARTGETVKGEVRAAQAEVIEMQQREEWLVKQQVTLKNTARSWRHRGERLASSVVEQSIRIADLEAEVASLRMLEKEREREARLVEQLRSRDRKVHERNERTLQAAHFKEDMKSEAEHFRRRQLLVTQHEAAEVEANSRLKELESRVADADDQAEQALRAAEQARQEAIDDAAVEASAAEDEHNWAITLLEKRLVRTEKKAQAASSSAITVPSDRTAEEWAKLTADANRKAGQRERRALDAFLASHEWRAADIATVASKRGLLAAIFDSEEGTQLFMERLAKLLKEMETNDFGMEFALFLHFELQLTLHKIHRIMQAGCKQFNSITNRYAAKPLFFNKYKPNTFIKVPRIAPPEYKIRAVLTTIYTQLGIEIAEDGRVAYRPLSTVVQDLLSHDPGRYSMPPLPFFLGGAAKLPLLVQYDGTGFGKQQFCTIVIGNPFTPKSAQLLRPIGLANCSDNRSGAVRAFGPNLAEINELINADRENRPVSIGGFEIVPEVLVILDLSALRKGENMANSGWCTCSREDALRKVPPPPPPPPHWECDVGAWPPYTHSQWIRKCQVCDVGV